MEILDQESVSKMGNQNIVKRVQVCVESIQTNYYNLGALLSRVRDEGMFVMWEGNEYATFEEWCEEVLKFRSRKAQHLITIYKKILDINPSSKLKAALLELGWAKVAQVLRVADTPKELKKWVAAASDMTLRELIGKVKFDMAQGQGATEEDQVHSAAAGLVTRKFKVSDLQNATLDRALDVLTKRFPSQSDGERLNMMVLAFLSSHVDDSEGGLAVELGYLIHGLEQAYGVKLKVVKTGGKKASTKKLKKLKKLKKVS